MKTGRPKKPKNELVKKPTQFLKDEELGLSEMQTAFVWFYTEGACGQTEAARKAGYQFPAVAANKMLNGKTFPKVTKAIRIKQDELAEKYAITPQKTGTMLWKITETAYETGQLNAAVSAIKELNQLAGLSVNRTQSLNINANLETMSKEDIKERLNKLMGVDTTYSAKDMCSWELTLGAFFHLFLKNPEKVSEIPELLINQRLRLHSSCVLMCNCLYLSAHKANKPIAVLPDQWVL